MADYNRSELDTPYLKKRRKFFKIDDDTVGAYAEKVARFFGTGSYLMWQTVFVTVWILLNVGGWWFSWDEYPFILLNLAFSTQAAYAAPLILLAQNRQEDRDRISLNEDRRRALETKADTEFITRELAGLRLAVGEMVSRDYLRHELEDLQNMLERIEAKLDDEAAARIALQHELHDRGIQELSDPIQGDVVGNDSPDTKKKK
ncbi:DUF1003 domain-containing protein [Corynebacterium sp. sy017]|uniref:DUF1003 domain-containing protein n=1 Tax=unclassified Corynebacterium TaxID=2624378 RepID=UPI0011859F7D|nr:MULTISPECIES: DUF1003 domain-containing protein [unclassified Corynebacterium]MBP3088969.1 DUF1003 domain-containing protein [Corynebacterium sp. sy017]QDZ42340.1 DUF1003 domain-containing protein [Corynebacterium sp. sy039]TSD91293.1 DUF1003 domain-containing protein [Corynebacterium sp. SY003]